MAFYRRVADSAMKELIEAAASWQTLLGAVVIFSLIPEVALQVIVKIYPATHPRRRELVADLAIVPRWERPFWVAEQAVTVVFEGVPLRIGHCRVALASGSSLRVHQQRILGVASIMALIGSVLAAGAYQAGPGDALWPLGKALYANHARSIQAAADITTSLERARLSLQQGRTGQAAEAIREVRAQLDLVSPAQGSDMLFSLQAELSVQLATVDPSVAATHPS
jgi:hypothetical protein